MAGDRVAFLAAFLTVFFVARAFCAVFRTVFLAVFLTALVAGAAFAAFVVRFAARTFFATGRDLRAPDVLAARAFFAADRVREVVVLGIPGVYPMTTLANDACGAPRRKDVAMNGRTTSSKASFGYSGSNLGGPWIAAAQPKACCSFSSSRA